MSDSWDTGDEPEERLLCAKRGGKKSSWVDPMYASQPEILWDHKTVVTREWFAEKYKLHNHGITPKQIKIGQHLEEADVESLFGPRMFTQNFLTFLRITTIINSPPPPVSICLKM
jgi:hypothetical protein